MAALAAPAGGAVAGVKLTIAITPPYLDYGEAKVVVAGQLTGKGNAGKKVVLHQEYPPQTTFSTVGSAVTNKSGIYKFVFPIHMVVSNRKWYVTGPGGVRSPTVEVKVGAAISVFAAHPTVLLGNPVVVTADIFPLDGDTVYLEQQVGSSWKKVDNAMPATDFVELVYTPTTPGTVTLRIWWPGNAQVVATSSDTVKVVIKPSTTPTTTTTSLVTTPAGTTVTVTTGVPQTYAFELSTSTQPKVVSYKPATELTVPAGEVTFDVTNPVSNVLSHTFEVCTTPLAKPVTTLAGVQALPNSCTGEVTPLLAPGGPTATLAVDLTAPGAYEYLSTANNPDGDAFSGMKGVLNVT